MLFADLAGVGEQEMQAGDVIKATLTLQPQRRERDRHRKGKHDGQDQVADYTATLPVRGAAANARSTRHSKSLDQLRSLQGPHKTANGTVTVNGQSAPRTDGWMSSGAPSDAEALSRSSECVAVLGMCITMDGALPPPPRRFRAQPGAADQDGAASSTESNSDSPPHAAGVAMRHNQGRSTYRRLETSASVPYDLSGQNGVVVDGVVVPPLPDLDALGLGSSRSTISLPSVLGVGLDLGLGLDEVAAALGFPVDDGRPRPPRRAASCESMPNLTELGASTARLLPPSGPTSPTSPAPNATM